MAFVDEIKNNNMANNLKKTRSVFEKNGEKTTSLNFYGKGDKHFKLGYFKPFIYMFSTILHGLAYAIISVSGKSQLPSITHFLYKKYLKYIETMEKQGAKEIYLMTDHHFFSSILANEYGEKCAVIQHGLVMDKKFYYPVRAAKFCAWGERSKELQKNDPKVIVTGTYKFQDMKNNYSGNNDRIMFCIGSLDNESVKRKIGILLRISKEKGFKLLVKCHPGSLFDKSEWEELFKGEDVAFYKEELIQDIDFDIAISENSTAIMDLIALHKSFILFDDIEGYFAEYKDIIPHGNTENEIAALIDSNDPVKLEKITSLILKNELNSGKCTIYESRKV